MRNALKALLLLATLLLAGCATNLTPAYPTDTPGQKVIARICGIEGAVCLDADSVEALELLQDDVYRGEFHSHTVPWAKFNTNLGVAIIEMDECERDPEECAFVAYHELGHRFYPDQTKADCYAAARTTLRERTKGTALICSFNDEKRCAALKKCGAVMCQP